MAGWASQIFISRKLNGVDPGTVLMLRVAVNIFHYFLIRMHSKRVLLGFGVIYAVHNPAMHTGKMCLKEIVFIIWGIRRKTDTQNKITGQTRKIDQHKIVLPLQAEIETSPVFTDRNISVIF